MQVGRERITHIKLLAAVGQFTWADADLFRPLQRPTAVTRRRILLDDHKARGLDQRPIVIRKAVGVQEAATGLGGVAITEHLAATAAR